MERNLAIDRPSAVMLGRRMQTRNIIDHVTSDREFADGHFFFNVKELPNAEDVRRVSCVLHVWFLVRPACNYMSLCIC